MMIGKNIKAKYLRISFVGLNFLSEYSPTIILSLNGIVIFSQINVPNKIDKTINMPNIKLNDFQGKWLVMYFYPKDFTAGCTLEAKGFSELKKDFSKNNAEIVGISADNQNSHESFCSEKSINYTLLSDPEGIISDKYGSWIPPFSDRNTFLISPEGEISYRWISVLPINHAKEVLNVLKKKI